MVFTTDRGRRTETASLDQSDQAYPPRPPLRWVDGTSRLAYLCVRDGLDEFGDFLEAVEHLVTHPNWRPGMPIVEDLRQCPSAPPVTCVERWRAYIAAHRPQLEGCRWAVVTRGDNTALVSMLERAARDAAVHGVTMRRFSNMLDAHLWVQR